MPASFLVCFIHNAPPCQVCMYTCVRSSVRVRARESMHTRTHALGSERKICSAMRRTRTKPFFCSYQKKKRKQISSMLIRLRTSPALRAHKKCTHMRAAATQALPRHTRTHISCVLHPHKLCTIIRTAACTVQKLRAHGKCSLAFRTHINSAAM